MIATLDDADGHPARRSGADRRRGRSARRVVSCSWPRPRRTRADEIERLTAEGKAPIAAKRQMQVQIEQGRVAVWTLRVGVAILMLTVFLVLLTLALVFRGH